MSNMSDTEQKILGNMGAFRDLRTIGQKVHPALGVINLPADIAIQYIINKDNGYEDGDAWLAGAFSAIGSAIGGIAGSPLGPAGAIAGAI